MKKRLLLFLVFLGFSTQFFAQSTCATAQLITAGTYTVTSVNGTQVPTPVCASGGTGATAGAWYKYIPNSNYSVTVTTDLPSNGNIDNRVNVYNGTCSGLTCVAGDDDSGTGLLCVVTFQVTAGTTYYIAFDNRWSSLGFNFQLNESAPIVVNPELVDFTNQNVPSINGTYKIAVADMNGDYLDDIIAVSSTNIQIHYQGAGGSFSQVNYTTSAATYLPTWSMAIGDLNKDGYNDLLYGSGTGVTFMKSNGLGTGYVQTSGSEYVFSQRSNFIDINNDGNLDAFVCHDVAPNVYYLNDGAGNLSFNQGGIGDHPNGGNYGSIWVDYNNDGYADLFVAKCRGGVNTAKRNELHRNNGDGTFTNVSVAANMADSIQTWSSAWNDFDNDGFLDAVIMASSNVDGSHKFLHNNGNGTFSNITAGSGIDAFSANVSIENVSYDFNNDGFADIFTNNYILFNNGNNTFTPVYMQMPVGAVGDLNNDGFLDVQVGNSIYYNNRNANNWIKIGLEGNTSNRNGIAARLELYGAWGKQIRDVQAGIGFKYMGTLNPHFGIGTATSIDSLIVKWPSGKVDVICNPTINQLLVVVEGSAPVAIADFTPSASVVGIGSTVDFTDLSTVCPNEWQWSVSPASGWNFASATNAYSQHPSITFNSSGTYTVSLVASNSNGPSTNVSSEMITVYNDASLAEGAFHTLKIFPNPAHDLLSVEAEKNLVLDQVQIISVQGVVVKNLDVNTNTWDISSLTNGSYFLHLKSLDGQVFSMRFVKH